METHYRIVQHDDTIPRLKYLPYEGNALDITAKANLCRQEHKTLVALRCGESMIHGKVKIERIK